MPGTFGHTDRASQVSNKSHGDWQRQEGSIGRRQIVDINYFKHLLRHHNISHII